MLPADGEPSLAYATDMERDEAAATGLSLLTPARLARTDPDARASSSSSSTPGRWRAALRECGVAGGPIGLAGSYPAGALAIGLSRLQEDGFRVLDFNGAMCLARKRKTDAEKREIVRVAGVVCEAMRTVAGVLASAAIDGDALRHDGVPLTAGHLRRRIRDVFARAGLEQPEGNIVSAGPDAGVPHTQGSDHRELRAGQSIVVDLYPRGGLYADCTRTFCVGRAPGPLGQAHALVLEALRQATEAARVGAAAESLQTLVCDILEADGWETPRSTPGTTRGYVHGLGHGVGYQLHELPSFRGEGPQSRLEPGDVFTLEPGLYDVAAGFGVRIEDLFYLDEAGSRPLTPIPHELDPAAW